MFRGLALLLLVTGCASVPEESAPAVPPENHGLIGVLVLDSEALAVRNEVGIDSSTPFTYVGLRWDALADQPVPRLEVRAQNQAGMWSDWILVQATWSEGIASNGFFEADEPSLRFEVQGVNGLPAHLTVELLSFPRPTHLINPSSPLDGRGFALAPPKLAHDRVRWGARPSRCEIPRGQHRPQAITLHHTLSRNNDPADSALRIRQIQAYQMDVLGMCDVGYHFFITSEGTIWQGYDDVAQGRHTYGHNADGNLGIALVGHFETRPPSTQAMEATAHLIAWISRTYRFPITRSSVLGHGEWAGTYKSCPGTAFAQRLDGLANFAAMTNPDNWINPCTGDNCAPDGQCPAADGLYCGSAARSQNPDHLYQCTAGNYTVYDTCADGCEPLGGDDQCRAETLLCPFGNGFYCGQDVELPEDVRYRCTDGHFEEQEACTHGCRDGGCVPPP